MFEINIGNVNKARKLLKIGHALNPRDPVLLQSLALLEYKNSTANLARQLFRRASELDPRHQPVWTVWLSYQYRDLSLIVNHKPDAILFVWYDRPDKLCLWMIQVESVTCIPLIYWAFCCLHKVTYIFLLLTMTFLFIFLSYNIIISLYKRKVISLFYALTTCW